MRFPFSILFLLLNLSLFAQEKMIDFDTPDSLYREDQFYLSLSNNNIRHFPDNFSQFKLSPSVSFGFQRDMPINKNRTWAIAAGLGYSYNIINHNVYQYQTTNYDGTEKTNYEIITPDIYYTKNRQTLSYIDLPIEIRWRTSTPTSHKFTRIYTGFKVSYLIGDKYKFVNDIQTTSIKSNADFNPFQYGCYMAVGWNTWNAYGYYGLNPLFKSGSIAGKSLEMNSFNVGLMFYIL